ncbi:MAG: HAD family phosphatase [Bacilli bacterium]|nr:HAD family phosphatase [Bacilli bacterium]
MKKLDELKLEDKKYIIFDMDGTLIDSIGVWNRTDQKLMEEYGRITIDLDIIQKQRDEFLNSNPKGDSYLTYVEYLIKKYGLSINAEELLKVRWDISNKILEKEMDFKPGSVELILKLKSLGFTVVLATMTTQVQLDIYSNKNKKMAEQMCINKDFDLIIRKEDVKYKKPHPEIYNKIVEYYHTTPNECLIFEDSYTGVLAANKAGIEVVNIYDKYADIDREKIDDITDYKIDSYDEFTDFVDTIYSDSKKLEKSII